MRCLIRNKTTIYYALYTGKTAIEDEYGNKTGEYTLNYSDFVALKVNVSAGSGESQVEQFGQNLQYDKVIVIDDINCPINESSIICIDIEPDNETKDHDYIVKKVAKSINSISYAISKVDVS